MDGGTERGTLKSSPNVTPLVDVVLVLLILFIVLIPAVDQSVRLPKARHAGAREGGIQPVILVLSADGSGPGLLRVETERGQAVVLPLGTESLRRTAVAQLRARLAERENSQIFLKADGGLPFHRVQSLFDLCREAGAELVSAVTASDIPTTPEGGRS